MSDVLAVSQGGASARDVALTLNRIYFLDLKAVRHTLGHKRWLAKRAIVHGVTRSCIHSIADPEDCCVQLSDDQYTLVFGTDNVEEIASRCKGIADAIEDKLFGERNLGRVVVRDAASVFSEGAVVKPDDQRPDGRALLDPQDDPEEEPSPEGATGQGIGTVLSEAERKARRDSLLALLDDEQEAALTHGYLPIWHARESRIATFICRPRRGDGPGSQVGYGVLGDAPDAAAIAKLDTYGIEECLFALKKISDHGAQISLMASVHFETLANRTTRSQLQAFLGEIPNRYGRLLILHLADVPTGIPEARLTEISANLTTWVGSVAVTIKMSECPTLEVLGARSWQYRRARIGIIGLDFEDEVCEEALERARRLAGVLVPRGLQLAAVNVPTSAALSQLSASKFTFLGGGPIGGIQSRPHLPRAFTRRDLNRF